MQIKCPWCGIRELEEFNYGGDASRSRPEISNLDHQDWYNYLYERENPRGPHREFWHHERGCRSWLVVKRDTLSHEIIAVDLASKADL